MRLKKVRALEVVIVDKTVPFEKYREHAAIPWILHAMKLQGQERQFLDAATDYVGFDPKAKTGHDLTAAALAKADILVVTDTYGVYQGDYERPGDQAALERSPKIYGGLTADEASAMEGFVARGGPRARGVQHVRLPHTGARPRARGEALRGPLDPLGRALLAEPAGRERVPAWVGRVWNGSRTRPSGRRHGLRA